MARDKLYEMYMAGKISALNIVKKDGVEALERDIRKRNITKIIMDIPEKEIDRIFVELGENLRSTVMTIVYTVLYDVFDFRKVRLHRFKDGFNKIFNDVFDLDYMGEHYVRLEDFAIEMNEKYNMGIDLRRVIVCQGLQDKEDKRYHMMKAECVIQELKTAGFEDAAEFLEAKLD